MLLHSRRRSKSCKADVQYCRACATRSYRPILIGVPNYCANALLRTSARENARTRVCFQRDCGNDPTLPTTLHNPNCLAFCGAVVQQVNKCIYVFSMDYIVPMFECLEVRRFNRFSIYIPQRTFGPLVGLDVRHTRV